MKAYISVSGDPSVGIFPASWEAELPECEMDANELEDLRAELCRIYSMLAGEPATVRFSIDPPEREPEWEEMPQEEPLPIECEPHSAPDWQEEMYRTRNERLARGKARF